MDTSNTSACRSSLAAALSGPFWRKFALPAPLEAGYHDWRQALAIENIREHWGLVVAAIALIGLATFLLDVVEPAMAGLVQFGFAAVFISIAAVVVAALVERWNPRIDQVLSMAAFIGLGGMQAGAVIVPEGSALRSVAEYGVIFITIAVATISGLSFRRAMLVIVLALVTLLLASGFSLIQPLAPVGSGLPPALLAVLDGFTPDWARFPYYAGVSVVIAAVMALARELRERTVYLQEELLKLEKAELDSLARELAVISRQDALTGLANRRHFNEMFEREWSIALREGSAMNVVFIDVDYFKRYNDHYGHQAGDQCLARVAAALAGEAKRGSDFLARYGGEEFVALFPRTSADGLQAIAQRLVDAVDALALPHELSVVAPRVTISVGIASLMPRQQQAPETVLRAADAALYDAKQAGRHCWRMAQ